MGQTSPNLSEPNALHRFPVKPHWDHPEMVKVMVILTKTDEKNGKLLLLQPQNVGEKPWWPCENLIQVFLTWRLYFLGVLATCWGPGRWVDDTNKYLPISQNGWLPFFVTRINITWCCSDSISRTFNFLHASRSVSWWVMCHPCSFSHLKSDSQF